MSELPCFGECCNKPLPIGAIHRDGPAVLTPTPGGQEEGCGFSDSNGGLIDSQPSGINRGPPFDVVERRGGRLLFRLGAGILELKVEDDIRIGKSNGSHQLGKASFWRGKRRASGDGGG